MINLLPPEEKRQLRAARTNTLLARYNIILLGAVIFLALATGIVYLYLTSTKASADQTVRENATQTEQYANVLADTEQFRSDLSVAKQILDREIPYTSVILSIAQILPSGVILDSLVLDSEQFGAETQLQAAARNYDGVLALKDALQDSPFFSDVHFQSVATVDDPNYPLSVTINVTISKEITQ